MLSFYSVIPAGGSGKRLWPLSRMSFPKFLHPFGEDGSTLLQATINRLSGLSPLARTYVVTSGSLAPIIARELPELPAENLLVEPSPMDSAPAICLAAAVIAERDPDAVMGSFAADHVIRNTASFQASVETAARGALDGYLMTVGVTPTRPETGYGYMRCGEPLYDGSIMSVEEFKEKPELSLAESYFESKRYLWNASFFVWRVRTFLDEVQQRQPEMYEALRRIAAAWDTDSRDAVLGELWSALPKIAIEYLIMEPASRDGRVATVPGDFGWSDIGDYQALGELYSGDEHGNVVVGVGSGHPRVLTRDSKRLVLVPGGKRLIAAAGVSDLVIVDTDDVLLVCDRSRVQEVKELVAHFESSGATEYI